MMLVVSPLAAGFPLTTEDTGTLGSGRSKVEMIGEWGYERENGTREVSVTNEITIVHGLFDSLNGSLTLPYREARIHESLGTSTHARGLGDVKFGMKWRYFEWDGLSLGVKTSITAPTGDDSVQLGSGKSTQAVHAIASYEIAPWELHSNLGYERHRNTQNEREHLAVISAAVVRGGLGSRWKIMADIGLVSNKNKNSNELPVHLGAGLSYVLTKVMSLEAGMKHSLKSAKTDLVWLVGMSLRF